MERDNASDLLAFLAVAKERSFTRAAARLGISQSALSQIVRGLEQRLGVQLLNRTTRSVAPTQAGERLFQNIGPRFEEMDNELAALSELRDRGLLAYHLNDLPSALRDLQTYLKLSSLAEMDEDERKEQEQIWEHVKTLRRRVASLN